MTVWQWLTKGLDLKDERDIWARIGFHFVWCTAPYFLLAFILSAFGITVMLSPWISLWILCIPVIGEVVDWRRLKHRPEHASGTTR